jgi:hypothetical protein
MHLSELRSKFRETNSSILSLLIDYETKREIDKEKLDKNILYYETLLENLEHQNVLINEITSMGSLHSREYRYDEKKYIKRLKGLLACLKNIRDKKKDSLKRSERYFEFLMN